MLVKTSLSYLWQKKAVGSERPYAPPYAGAYPPPATEYATAPYPCEIYPPLCAGYPPQQTYPPPSGNPPGHFPSEGSCYSVYPPAPYASNGYPASASDPPKMDIPCAYPASPRCDAGPSYPPAAAGYPPLASCYPPAHTPPTKDNVPVSQFVGMFLVINLNCFPFASRSHRSADMFFPWVGQMHLACVARCWFSIMRSWILVHLYITSPYRLKMFDSFESTNTKMQNHQVFHSCSSLQGEQQNSETLMVSTSIIKHGIFEHGKIQARHGETQVEIGMPLSKLPLVRRDCPVENWSI